MALKGHPFARQYPDVMTQRFLLNLSSLCKCLSGRFHPQRLMRALVIVEPNPAGYDPTGVLQTLEAMTVHALLLQRLDDAFDHAVLLRAMWRDELLL